MNNKKFEYGEEVYVIHRSGFSKEIKLVRKCKFVSIVMHDGYYLAVIDNGKRIVTIELNNVRKTKEEAFERAIKELKNNIEYNNEASKRCNELISSLQNELLEGK